MVAVNRAARPAVTMKFNEMLQGLREKAKLTQQQLADRARIPIGSLRNYEQGHRLPSFAAAAKLARALRVPLDRLATCDELADDDEIPPATPPKK